jgi:hypothetical protein
VDAATLSAANMSVLVGLRTTLQTTTAQLLPADTPVDAALRAQADDYSAQLTQLSGGATTEQVNRLKWQIMRFANMVQTRFNQPQADFGVATADSMTLVYPRDNPFIASAPEVSLARGEYESIQAVVIPYIEPLTQVSARISSIVGPDGNEVADGQLRASVAPLGSLYVQPSTYYTLPALPNSDKGYVGWVPDPIRADLTAVDVAVGDFQPFWIELFASTQAQPGTYQVTVSFSAAGKAEHLLNVKVEVWPFALPDRPKLPATLTWNPAVLNNLYTFPDFKAQYEMVDTYHDFMQTFKIEPDSIYRRDPPLVEDLLKIKEKWGLRQFNVYYIAREMFDIERPESWQPKIDQIIGIIDRAMVQYEKAGLAQYAYIYGFDECEEEFYPVAREVFKQLKERFPNVPIMTTLRDLTLGINSGLAGLVDIWVPSVHRFVDKDVKAVAQALGDQVYWYTYISVQTPFPNWFNGYQPSDTRLLLGALSYKMNVDGFLYYNITNWKANRGLLTDGIFSAWDARTFRDDAYGDGSLFYPGKDGPMASQRIQNYRDGMEDYNLLVELQNRVDHTLDAPAELVAQAKALLSADAVATDHRQYTKNASVYRAWRDEVAAAIIRFDAIDPTVAERTFTGEKEYGSGPRPVSAADVYQPGLNFRAEASHKVWFKQPTRAATFTEPFPVEVFIPPAMTLQEWRVSLNGTVLFSGVEAPTQPLTTLDLTDGAYSLLLQVTEENGRVWESRFAFAVRTSKITAPDNDTRVSGDVPIEVSTKLAPELIQDVLLTLMPVTRGTQQEDAVQVLYQANAMPTQPLVLDTLKLLDGPYVIELKVVDKNGNVAVYSVNINVKNWEQKSFVFRLPLHSMWLGTITYDETIMESDGWDYESSNAQDFFGDENRRVWKGSGTGYLVWETPHVHSAKLTLFARQQDLAGLTISVSRDQQHWEELQLTVSSSEQSAAGWYKLEVECLVDGDTANYLRIGMPEQLNATNAQLGEIDILLRVK